MVKKRIGFIAQDMRKNLLYDFCTAYSGFLKNHTLVATGRTAEGIERASGLNVQGLLPGTLGGGYQITSEIQGGKIDILFFFRTPDDPNSVQLGDKKILDECDRQNVPIATNFATAEAIMYSLVNGIYDVDMGVVDDAIGKQK